MSAPGDDTAVGWESLARELDLWQQQGLTPTLWWRDDDAATDTPALQRLNGLSRAFSIPLHLAVIPARADASLLPLFGDNPRLCALQHGYRHQNHEPSHVRKSELGQHRIRERLTDELRKGQARLRQLLGEWLFCPVLVPPWNRLADEIPPLLAELGFVGLSTLGPRPAPSSHGIRLVNVHIDLIDWRQRAFAGEERVLGQLLEHLRQRRGGRADAAEPTGLMTHHLEHDESCWRFCQQLFRFLENYRVHWLDQRELFPRTVNRP